MTVDILAAHTNNFNLITIKENKLQANGVLHSMQERILYEFPSTISINTILIGFNIYNRVFTSGSQHTAMRHVKACLRASNAYTRHVWC